MKGAWMIMCINNHKAATSLVVLVSKPVLEDVKNLGSDKTSSTLKMIIDTQSANQYSWIATTSLCIVDMAIQAVARRAVKVSCLNAIVGNGEETDNMIGLFFCNEAIGFTQEFFAIEISIICEEVIQILLYLAIATRERCTSILDPLGVEDHLGLLQETKGRIS